MDISKRTVLYRVAQEALTNVARNAKASRVEVNIHSLPKAVGMAIKDDGKAFQVERVFEREGQQTAGRARHAGARGDGRWHVHGRIRPRSGHNCPGGDSVRPRQSRFVRLAQL